MTQSCIKLILFMSARIQIRKKMFVAPTQDCSFLLKNDYRDIENSKFNVLLNQSNNVNN